ncbi:MAG: monovalent cation/H(+) antiporter subunit G [Candidatus Competibacterales bacterium]|nr:monovalent cation/H(+) antiporter subunit G [Candidatus Competibacterales bacterium]
MTAADWIAVVFLLGAAGFFFAGTMGMLRFPDTLCRLHALTKADNVGLGLLCLGLAVHERTLSGTLTLVFVWVFALVASTVSAFLIAGWADARSGGDHES